MVPHPAPSVLLKTKSAYALWHTFFEHLPRIQRQTIGLQIDAYFRQLLELLFRASFSRERGEKIILVKQATAKLDFIKFFLQLAWEQKFLDNKKYDALSAPLDEIGKMLGGWLKQLSQKTPA